MIASRELNALIAEKVMGAEPHLSWNVMSADETSSAYRGDSKEDCERFLSGMLSRHPTSWLKDYHVGAWELWPCYSTDISAAWAVLEKLHPEFGWELSDCRQPGLPFAASIYPISELSGKDRDEQQGVIDEAYVIAETMPLAICKAALKAVGYAEAA